jgi:hypothetical protein
VLKEYEGLFKAICILVLAVVILFQNSGKKRQALGGLVVGNEGRKNGRRHPVFLFFDLHYRPGDRGIYPEGWTGAESAQDLVGGAPGWEVARG